MLKLVPPDLVLQLLHINNWLQALGTKIKDIKIPGLHKLKKCIRVFQPQQSIVCIGSCPVRAARCIWHHVQFEHFLDHLCSMEHTQRSLIQKICNDAVAARHAANVKFLTIRQDLVASSYDFSLLRFQVIQHIHATQLIAKLLVQIIVVFHDLICVRAEVHCKKQDLQRLLSSHCPQASSISRQMAQLLLECKLGIGLSISEQDVAQFSIGATLRRYLLP
mmetsp:Transcript_5370/g.9553  ORF Transcript_5370/g.9553 Transcript_5370/m.9553 type:complete len:220 (+) Transcript_5370:308-967(+)